MARSCSHKALQSVCTPFFQLWVVTLLVVLLALLDVLFGAKNNWHALMYRYWRDVHHTAVPGNCKSASLFQQERHRRCLIEQAKFSVLVLGICWIGKQATIEKCSVHVTNHRPNVPEGVLVPSLAISGLDVLNVVLEGLVPVFNVGLIARVDLATAGNLNVWTGQHVLPNGAVQGEADDAPSQREDQFCGAAVKHIACSHQRLARLQGGGKARDLITIQVLDVCRQVTNCVGLFRFLENSEDCADSNASIHVAASIQRIEHTDIFSSVRQNCARCCSLQR
mmetsp:Transcript_12506/g.20567  ORF Transcript_12506/g.20567 Transcript_12506/m.20567 type:complete len:280 (+) Transcript_12506:72-911(+)